MKHVLCGAAAGALVLLVTRPAVAAEPFQFCCHHKKCCEPTSCYDPCACEPHYGPVRRLLRKVFHRCPPPCAPVTSCCPADGVPAPMLAPANPAPRLLPPPAGDVAPPPAFPSARSSAAPVPPMRLEHLASFQRERSGDGH